MQDEFPHLGLILVYWLEHLGVALIFCQLGYKTWTRYVMAVYEIEMLRLS